MSGTRTPATPKAGGLTTDNIPWSGGKQNTTAAQPKTPFCLHPTDYKSFLKVYELAVKGAEHKFGNDLLDYPLLAFCKMVAKHMADYGMDSMFHFMQGGQEVNILVNYTAFTLSKMKSEVAKLKASEGDAYDLNNLDWSESYLLNSITLELQNAIMNKISEAEVGGPLLWMYIVQYVESNTATAHQALLDELKVLQVKAFPGENVKMCTEKLSTICCHLALADELPRNIGLLLCHVLTACSVDEFCLTFIPTRGEFDLDHKYKTWEELITIADRCYQSLLDSQKWIKINPNKAAAALMAQGLKPRVVDVICHNCGKKGHYARNCCSKVAMNVEAKSEQPSGAPTKKPKVDAWKLKPPTKDAPHMQTVNDKQWFWCGKCSHWTLSHLTANHKGAQPKNGKSAAELQGASGLASASMLTMVSGL